MNDILQKILKEGKVRDRFGKETDLHSNIDLREGKLLQDVIEQDQNVRKTLEVGCAYGISSLFICEALSKKQNPHHTIIDPYQDTDWKGIGTFNLKQAGLNFFDLIEEPSEYALPKLAQKEAGKFDLVLIDGWHTFDHTLLDFFYANKLVRIGGYVAIDDCHFMSISRVVSYVLKYPAYKLHSMAGPDSSRKKMAFFIKKFLTNKFAKYLFPKIIYDLQYGWANMVILKKIAPDDRSWDWFESF